MHGFLYPLVLSDRITLQTFSSPLAGDRGRSDQCGRVVRYCVIGQRATAR